MQTQKYLRKHCRVPFVCNTPLIGAYAPHFRLCKALVKSWKSSVG